MSRLASSILTHFPVVMPDPVLERAHGSIIIAQTGVVHSPRKRINSPLLIPPAGNDYEKEGNFSGCDNAQ